MIRQIPTPPDRYFLLLLTACQIYSPDAQQQEVPPRARPSLMDTSVNAAADFYRFVNGGWLDQVEIPADEDSWGL